MADTLLEKKKLNLMNFMQLVKKTKLSNYEQIKVDAQIKKTEKKAAKTADRIKIKRRFVWSSDCIKELELFNKQVERTRPFYPRQKMPFLPLRNLPSYIKPMKPKTVYAFVKKPVNLPSHYASRNNQLNLATRKKKNLPLQNSNKTSYPNKSNFESENHSHQPPVKTFHDQQQKYAPFSAKIQNHKIISQLANQGSTLLAKYRNTRLAQNNIHYSGQTITPYKDSMSFPAQDPSSKPSKRKQLATLQDFYNSNTGNNYAQQHFNYSKLNKRKFNVSKYEPCWTKQENNFQFVKKKANADDLREEKVRLRMLMLLPKFEVTDTSKLLLGEDEALNVSRNYTEVLNVVDLQEILIKALSDRPECCTSWGTITYPRTLRKINLIVIDDVSCHQFWEKRHELTQLWKLLKTSFKLSMAKSFPKELMKSYPMGMRHEKKSYSKAKKLDLLLSPFQMMLEGYPGPGSRFKKENFVFTSDNYKPVSEDSPMFGLDCEMCRCRSGNLLTRVSLVDENYTCLYDTLVMPPEPILNYVTRFSGITKEMLEGVTTTVKDVQEELRKLLPPDAILVGQSLGGDLKAVQMIHPYVIDSSVIYNFGEKGVKAKLKLLNAAFVGDAIQTGKDGHNPTEDSIGALKLAQSKVKIGLQFGDLYLDKKCLDHINGPQEMHEYSPGLLSNLNKEGRKMCIVGPQNSLLKYKRRESKSVTTFQINSLETVVSETIKQISTHNLIVSHFPSCKEEVDVNEIDSAVKNIYDKCHENTMIVMVFTDKYSETKEPFFSVHIVPPK